MNQHLKPHALFIFAIFATLSHAGAPAARASDACSPADFKLARSFDAGASGGSSPASYVAADFNGDGRPDLAVTEFNNKTVGVLLNDGTGWLGATTRFSVQDGPEFVAVGDFNGDGRPDLAVTNSGSNSVSVLLGTGGGNFGAATHFAIGGEPAGLAVGDFNGDGRPDLAVTNTTRRNVSVLLGDGAGSFAPAAGSASGSTQSPTALAVADFNSDAKRDLVVATFSSGVFVMLGDGAGGFSAPTQVFQQSTDGVAAADLNGDGKADLTFGEGGGLVVRLGDGAGGFSAPAVFPGATGGGFINRVAVADFDGDGKQDVVSTSTLFLDGLSLFKGDGAGGFSLTKSYLTRHSPASLAVADFDGDGDQDVAAGSALLFNTGGGEFEAIRTAFQLGEADQMNMPRLTDFTSGDFDGDGRPDVAVLVGGTAFVGSHVVVSLSGASGSFTSRPPRAIPGGIEYRRVKAADFNRDGKLDVAVVGSITSDNSTHVVLVSLGNGDGTFAAPTRLDVGVFGRHPSDLAVGDFNGDANPDLVVTFISSQNFLIMFGNGAGGFNFRSGGGTAPNFGRVAVGDFNGDAKQDLVFTDAASQRVLALSGDGTGGFGPVNFFAVRGRPTAVVVGDFNLDGKSDIAASTFAVTPSGVRPVEDGSVSVLLADGAGGFAPAIHHSAVFFPEDIVAADFDADGKTDLAVSSRFTSTVYVFSGDGAGGFSLPTSFGLIGGQSPSILISLPLILAPADFDGDNRNDLAAMMPASFAVGILSGKPPTTQPCLLADDVTLVEGDTGSVNAQIPVRLSGPSAQVVKVNYAIRGFPATEGQDFTGGTGSLVFQPGETSKFVSVPILGDNTDEPDESVALQFSNPAGARFGDDFAQIFITDNDDPPAISISDVTVTEDDLTNIAAVFNVTLSNPSTQTLRVDFSTADGTATAGSDYSAATGTVFFNPGTTAQTISVNIRADETHELTEHFFVNLSNPFDSTIADAQGRGTILDDDPVPTITIFNSFGSEFEGRAGVSATLSHPSVLPVTVNFSTADGTAAAGSDYNAATGTLTFNPGERQLLFNIDVLNDALDEVTETFFVNLSDPSNATIAVGQSLVRIIDNDGPTISVNDVSVGEGQSGLTNAVFTLSLSAPSVEDVFVRLRTANGTASAGGGFVSDYGVRDATVRINAGQTSANVTVSVIGDLTPEPDETFLVNLSNPQSATIADAQGVGTIVNDDATVRFGAAAVSANEADGSVLLTVTRTGPLTHPSTVNYETNDGTASDRSDYNAAIGALEFAPGEASKTITVFLTDDAHVEDAENFSVTLSNSGIFGGPVTSPETTVVTVNSDDVTPGPNPADDTTFFVRQHYRDFLGREPDADGLAFWTNEIESCGADLQCREVKRIHVSAAFFLSIEFQETGYLAYRAYKAAYGDATSPGVPGTVPVIRLREFLFDAKFLGRGVQVNVGNWQQQLEDNKQAYAAEFVITDRFFNAYPSTMTAEEFVSQLDLNAGGVLSAEERAELVALLGTTPGNVSKRAQVLRRVAEDADLRPREFNRAFVLMQYYGYLRRNPDDPQDTNFGGWKFWLDKLEEFGGNFVNAEMVKAFISSSEYRHRFGQ
ncbi:MAG: Calx-beta domain-containing protein [Pyrinomonadaceae bacterium]